MHATKMSELQKHYAKPWLLWLSGLSTGLQTGGLWVRSPVRQGTCLGCGPGPQLRQTHSWGHVQSYQSMFLSHIDVSLPLFLPPIPSL